MQWRVCRTEKNVCDLHFYCFMEERHVALIRRRQSDRQSNGHRWFQTFRICDVVEMPVRRPESPSISNQSEISWCRRRNAYHLVMHRLAYRSTRSRSLSDDQVVDGIVLPAMEKNRRLDITGCLWCGKSNFLQILEGDRETVRSLFKTIENDARHHDVELLEERGIAEREFSRFAMKLIRGDESDEIGALIRQFGYATDTRGDETMNGAGILQRLVALLIAGRGSA